MNCSRGACTLIIIIDCIFLFKVGSIGDSLSFCQVKRLALLLFGSKVLTDIFIGQLLLVIEVVPFKGLLRYSETSGTRLKLISVGVELYLLRFKPFVTDVASHVG